MSVPKQALEQLEKAEAALKKQEPAPAETVVQEEVGNDVLSSPNEDTQEVSPQIDTEALQRELELERQRNASLKGRVESQLKTANNKNKELSDQLESMQSKIDELSKQNKVPGSKRHITEEEAEELGEEVLDIQSRVIKGTLEEELESGKIEEMVKSILEKNMNVQQAKQGPNVDMVSFWNNVESFYPGAKDINSNDKGWFAFLDLYDKNSGLKNRDVGASAINNGDVASLVDLLRNYKPIGSSSVDQKQVTVKPETTAHARQTVEPKAPTFTKEGVKLFYQDIIDGKFKGKKGKQESEKIERQIMEAAQAGRIY